MDNPSSNATKHQGSCHCGAVRFEVTADLGAGATRCNCTICTKTGVLGIIVAPDALRVLSPEGDLACYEWGGKVARRYFCKHCGIHTFSRGDLAVLGGPFAAVNVNALDGIDPAQLKVTYWDGRHDNWMAGMRDAPWPILTASACPTAGWRPGHFPLRAAWLAVGGVGRGDATTGLRRPGARLRRPA